MEANKEEKERQRKNGNQKRRSLYGRFKPCVWF